MPAAAQYRDEAEVQPLTKHLEEDLDRRSLGSLTSVSTTSLVLDNLQKSEAHHGAFEDRPSLDRLLLNGSAPGGASAHNLEDGPPYHSTAKPFGRRVRYIIWGSIATIVGGWIIALVVFWLSRAATRASMHDLSRGSSFRGKKVTLDQVLTGQWRGQSHDIAWIEGANGEDGLLLERGGNGGKGYLVVEDVRSRSANDNPSAYSSHVLMREDSFQVGDNHVYPNDVWPSRDLNKVLVISDKESVSLVQLTVIVPSADL